MTALNCCTQVEGRCDGEYGYIISVVQITNKSQGLLKATTGFAAYTVTYTCLVLRPFRGEVMDVLVTSVSKVSLFTPILQYQFAALSSCYPIKASYIYASPSQKTLQVCLLGTFCRPLHDTARCSGNPSHSLHFITIPKSRLLALK